MICEAYNAAELAEKFGDTETARHGPQMLCASPWPVHASPTVNALILFHIECSGILTMLGKDWAWWRACPKLCAEFRC